MMATYAVISSTVSDPMRPTVHDAECRCVKAAMVRREPVSTVEAETASQAAKSFSEKNQLAERGLPQPEICKCAK
jgi:hypothetical protein